MSLTAPPRSPDSAPRLATDDDHSRRIHFRLWQISLTLITVVATAWFCSFMNWKSPLGALPGIVAIVVAKHILVAILVQGVDFHLGSKNKSTISAAAAAPDNATSS